MIKLSYGTQQKVISLGKIMLGVVAVISVLWASYTLAEWECRQYSGWEKNVCVQEVFSDALTEE